MEFQIENQHLCDEDFNQNQKDALDYREQEVQREMELHCRVIEQIDRNGFVSIESEVK